MVALTAERPASMPQRNRPVSRPLTLRTRTMASSTEEELECWIEARDAIEVLVAIAAARGAAIAAAERAADL